MYIILFFLGGCFLVFQGGKDVYVSVTEPAAKEVSMSDLNAGEPDQRMLIIKDTKFDLNNIWYSQRKRSSEVDEVYVALKPKEGQKVKYILQTKNEAIRDNIEKSESDVARVGGEAEELKSMLDLASKLEGLNPVHCMTGDWSDVDSDIEDAMEGDPAIASDVIFLYHDKSVSLGGGAVKLLIGLAILGFFAWSIFSKDDEDEENVAAEEDSGSGGGSGGKFDWKADEGDRSGF